jgi:hypothetical protein
MYGVAFRHVKAAALADEARFEEFWNTGAIQIVRADGKGYSNSEVTDVDVGDFPPWRSIARVKRPHSGSQAPSADSR